MEVEAALVKALSSFTAQNSKTKEPKKVEVAKVIRARLSEAQGLQTASERSKVPLKAPAAHLEKDSMSLSCWPTQSEICGFTRTMNGCMLVKEITKIAIQNYQLWN